MNKYVKIFGKDIEVLVESDADNSVFEEIFIDKDYSVCDEMIKKAGVLGVILDIGAHKGYFSIYASVLSGENVKIFSYEPEEKNFAVLKENLKMNRIKNVFAKNVAVKGSDGMCELFLSDDSHNHSVVVEAMASQVDIVDDESVASSRKVNCVSLRTIIEKHLVKEGCEIVDLVKMDCEGAEFEILESVDLACGKEIFNKIKAFCIEYHEFLPEMKAEKLVSILKKYGYKVDVKKSHYDNRMGFIWARR